MAHCKTPDNGILIGHSITKAWRLPPKSWGQRADLFLGKTCYLLPGDILELFIHSKSSQRILMVPRLWAKNTENRRTCLSAKDPISAACYIIQSYWEFSLPPLFTAYTETHIIGERVPWEVALKMGSRVVQLSWKQAGSSPAADTKNYHIIQQFYS